MPAIVDEHGNELRSSANEQQERWRDSVRSSFRRKYKNLVSKFGAAAVTVDNQRHWVNADGLSADAAANPQVRARLRNRARYECQENNPQGKGIILKHANAIVGKAPRLQMQTSDEAFNEFVEGHFEKWSKATKLGAKLRTMARSKTVDGEAFAQLITNEKLSHAVKLDLRLIEADQVTTPTLTYQDPNYIDGVKHDEDGNPLWYDVLKSHPGSSHVGANPYETVEIPAAEMVHWFREDRPNQRRGIPEVTTALPLFGQLRRFTLATIAAAETAAEMAGVIRTNASAVDEAESVDPMEAIDIEMRSLLTLPGGWDISQLKAEHPSTTYEMFERSILTQMAQPIPMPYNVASGDSSRHNFASGRLDHKMYEAAVDVERYDFACDQLQQIFAAWYREFALWARLSGAWAGEMPVFDELLFSWFFDQADHAVDPNREANGEKTRLASGSTNHAELYARRGLDWRKEFRKAAQSLGVSLEEYQALVRKSVFGAATASPPPTERGEAA